MPMTTTTRRPNTSGIHEDHDGVGVVGGDEPTLVSEMTENDQQNTLEMEVPVSRFLVTKVRSWRTNYTRILCLYRDRFTTIDPETYDVTNTFHLSGLRSAGASTSGEDDGAFCIEMGPGGIGGDHGEHGVETNAGGGGTTRLKFKCKERGRLLCELLRLRHLHGGGSTISSAAPYPSPAMGNIMGVHIRGTTTTTTSSISQPETGGSWPTFACHRGRRSGSTVPTVLRVAPYALIEYSPTSNNSLVHIRDYDYSDIEGISFLSDEPSAILIHCRSDGRCKLFYLEGGQGARSDLAGRMKQSALVVLGGSGLEVRQSVTSNEFFTSRQRKNSQIGDGEAAASVHRVSKFTKRRWYSGNVTPRVLVITSGHFLLERDDENGGGRDGGSLGGGVVSRRHLSHLFRIVRGGPGGFSPVVGPGGIAANVAEGTVFTLEYKCGISRTYASADRDAVLVSIVDACASMALAVELRRRRTLRLRSSAEVVEGHVQDESRTPSLPRVDVSDFRSDGYRVLPRNCGCDAASPDVAGEDAVAATDDAIPSHTISSYSDEEVARVELWHLRHLERVASSTSTELRTVGAAVRLSSDSSSGAGGAVRLSASGAGGLGVGLALAESMGGHQRSSQSPDDASPPPNRGDDPPPPHTTPGTAAMAPTTVGTTGGRAAAHALEICLPLLAACRSFNANVPPGGLTTPPASTISVATKKVISNVLSRLVDVIYNLVFVSPEHMAGAEGGDTAAATATARRRRHRMHTETICSAAIQATYRLIRTPTAPSHNAPVVQTIGFSHAPSSQTQAKKHVGFSHFVEIPNAKKCLEELLYVDDPLTSYWVVGVIGALCRCPFFDGDEDGDGGWGRGESEREQEYVNKQVLLGHDGDGGSGAGAESGQGGIGIGGTLVGLLVGEGGWEEDQKRGKTDNSPPASGEGVEGTDGGTGEGFGDGDGGGDAGTGARSSPTPGGGGEGGGSDLLLMAVGEVLEGIVCGNQDTTSPEQFEDVVGHLSEGYGALMEMLRSPCAIIVENAALLLQIITQHRPETSALVRDCALSSATLLRHFYSAVFSPVEGQRFLSRYLVSLWMSGPSDCPEKRLLGRMIPSGFLPYLTMPPLSDIELDNLDELERDGIESSSSSPSNDPGGGRSRRDEGSTSTSTGTAAATAAVSAGTNMTRLRRRIRLADATTAARRTEHGGGGASGTTASASLPPNKDPENFRILFHVMTRDHALPDLIWNQQTRRELRISLESELEGIEREIDLRGGGGRVAWNHQQFTVNYPSLRDEVRVGSIYMRLWLQAGDAFIKTWDDPVRLFELLFRRLLCDIDRNTKVTNMCIRCLERLYSKHSERIGVFEDVMILVRSMALTSSIETQHRILSLVATLLGVSDNVDSYGLVHVPGNAEQLLNAESISQLCQFVAWGHTNSAQVGNLLSTATGVGGGVSLLTDGTDVGPVGYVAGDMPNTANSSSTPSGSSDSQLPRKKKIASDACCPKVWFIAPAGTAIPPPSNKIRGPYRVSDLVSLMNDGEIHSQSLVSAAHVEDYSIDDDYEGATAVKEGSIDTGKWRMIEQVWQLRWQLCTDATSGVYGPSDVAHIALGALGRLVDLHKSVDGRGVPYHPIPIAKKLLCGLGRDPTASDAANMGDAKVMLMDQGDSLSVLSQAMLCNDHRVVDSAAKLIQKLMMHNDEACAKLYLTGAFFFACGYTGNNFRSIAELLHATHLKQTFQSGFAAAANEADLPLKDRSILGNLLPEGVLLMLVNYGVDRFTELFVGNFDTPEVIWNFEMRRHLVEMIRQHLGDFPQRLWQHTTDKYEYCPMPGVAYIRLEKELFCHNYYLNNLCDEVRFPEWPISEPVEVFRACLEEWKKQMSRDEVLEEDAQEEARRVLNLKSGDGSGELRKSYRSLARKYHPDKNPAGREMFEKVQVSYELLLPILEGGGTIQVAEIDVGPDDDSDDDESDRKGRKEDGISLGLKGGIAQMATIKLLMKTQIIICKRHAKEIGSYKYPAYNMLLQCLVVPQGLGDSKEMTDSAHEVTSFCLMKKDRAEFVGTAVELVFQTCLVSPHNAEELVVENGVSVLESLLHFYVTACRIICKSRTNKNQQGGLGSATAKSRVSLGACASPEMVLDIIMNIIHTLAGVAYFKSGRSAFGSIPNSTRLFANWRRCLDGVYWGEDGAPLIKKYALEGIPNLAKDSALQKKLVESGVVWPLIRCFLGYDPTLEEVSVEHDGQRNVAMSQAASNLHAQLAARALGMMCGVMIEPRLRTPANPVLYRAMQRILTEPICRLLRNQRSKELLRTLNANIETPTRIWNVHMRKELASYIDKVEEERDNTDRRSISEELDTVSNSFGYTNLSNEIIIGGIYVRVFNSLGGSRDAVRNVADPSRFCEELVAFISGCLHREKDCVSGKPPSVPTSDLCSVGDKKFIMAMTALRYLIRVDGLVEDVLCDDKIKGSATLLGLLELPQDNEAFDIGSEILSLMSPKQSFADALSRQGELWRLLRVLSRPEYCTSQSRDVVGLTNDVDAQSEEKDEGKRNAASAMASTKRQERGWALLESLASTPSVATSIVRSSGWLELLGILVGYSAFTKSWTGRHGAAKTLSRLLWDPKTGVELAPLLQRFLPAALVSCLKHDGADAMLRVFDQESETPELIWDGDMRSELRKSIAERLDNCLSARDDDDTDGNLYELPPGFSVKYRKLEDELCIGNVYVRLFLKEPTFNLRDPSGFLEMNMQRWSQELTCITSAVENEEYAPPSTSNGSTSAISTARQDVLQLVTSASVYLCKVRAALCDKLTQWGYMPQTLMFLNRALSAKMTGSPLVSTVRILHVASDRRCNVEALAVSGGQSGRGGVVDLLMQAVGPDPLHVDAAFIIETLKKIFVEALGDVENAPKWSEEQRSDNVAGNHAVDSNDASQPNGTREPNPAMRAGQYHPNGRNDGFEAEANGGYVVSSTQQQHGQGVAGGNSHPDGQVESFPLNTTPVDSAPRAYGTRPHITQALPTHPLSLASNGEKVEGNQSGNPLQGYHNDQYAATQETRESHLATTGNQSIKKIVGSKEVFDDPLSPQLRVPEQPSGPVTENVTTVDLSAQQPQGPNTFPLQLHGQQKLHNNALDRPMHPLHAAQGKSHTDPLRQHHTEDMPSSQQNQRPLVPREAPQQNVNYMQQRSTLQDQQHHPQHQYAQPMQQPSQPYVQQPQTPQQHVWQQSQYMQQPQTQHLRQHTQHMQQSQVQQSQFTQPLTFRQQYNQEPGNHGYGQAPAHAYGGQQGSRPQMTPVVPPPQVNQYTPAPTVGSGIDARSAPAPAVVADQKTATYPGAPGCAHGRAALLHSAIECDLPRFLVEDVLENPTVSKVKDPAAVKVHTVALLKLLEMDPGYGMKISILLDALPGWRQFKSQDHSLFITGTEQKADYFLTDGGTGKNKLLTEG